MPSPRHEVHRYASHGFTLLEIMVVIALLSLLAAAAEAFIITHRSEECPTPEEMKRDGVLSTRSKIEDPWGTPYRSVCESGSAIVISAGRDRTFETGDDVKSDDP